MNGKSIALFLAVGFILSIAAVCSADVTADLQQAESYVGNGLFSQAEPLCTSIVQNNPGSDYALKAQGKLTAIYIMTGRLSQSDTAVNTLISTYANKAELPAILYGVVLRYKTVKDSQRAQNLSQRICQQFPASQQAQRIQLDSGKEQALKFIADGNFPQAEAAVNNMAAAAGSNPAMPATLFKIAREFKEVGRNDETMRVYQKIVQNYPNSEFTGRARMGIDKLSIWNLIRAGDANSAQTALTKLISDYNGVDDLGHTVHGVALKFEEAGFYQQAKALYQKVKTDYAGTEIAARATVDSAKCDIRAAVGKSSFSNVKQQIDSLVAAFAGDAHLPLAICQISEEYYKQGARLERQGSTEQAKELYRGAAAVSDLVINHLPSSQSVPEACSYAGICYEKLGDYAKANQCYQKVIDGFPGYNLRWDMIFKIGFNYERMKRAGSIAAAQADAQIRAMYERLLTEYPDCPASKHAIKWLGR